MNKRSGFTIIEVALVLAIAGLIFLMAFIALPSLWASQRDADRKANVMAFISDLKTYQTNNSRGALPTMPTGNIALEFTGGDAFATRNDNNESWYNFVQDYVLACKDPGNSDESKRGCEDFTDPDGEKYYYYVATCNAVAPNACTNGRFSTVNAENADTLDFDRDGHVIYVAIGATCDGDRMVKTNSNRSVAALYVLERAGRYCYNT